MEGRNPALPMAAVEAAGPAISELASERRDEVGCRLVKWIGNLQRLCQSCLGLGKVRDDVGTGARGLHVEELDATFIIALNSSSVDTLDRIVALFIIFALTETCTTS
jgi:hypothetical protein